MTKIYAFISGGNEFNNFTSYFFVSECSGSCVDFIKKIFMQFASQAIVSETCNINLFFLLVFVFFGISSSCPILNCYHQYSKEDRITIYVWFSANVCRRGQCTEGVRKRGKSRNLAVTSNAACCDWLIDWTTRVVMASRDISHMSLQSFSISR